MRYSSAPGSAVVIIHPAPVVSPAHAHEYNIKINKITPGNIAIPDPDLTAWGQICKALGWYEDNPSKKLMEAIAKRGREYVAKAIEYVKAMAPHLDAKGKDKRGGLLRWGLFKGVIRFPQTQQAPQPKDQSIDSLSPANAATSLDPIPAIFAALKRHQVSDARLMLQTLGVSVQRAIEVVNARFGLESVGELRAMLAG